MSKSKGIIGTPVNYVGPKAAFIGNREGYGSLDLPKGYVGGSDTTASQFEGDQRGNRQVEEANGMAPGTLGTRARTVLGNPDEASRTRLADRYGKNLSGGGPIDMNDSKANGDGVLFDGVKRSHDYTATPSDVLDSPVRKGAQMPQNDASIKLNEIRNGQGDTWGADDAIEDSLVKADGVLGR